MSFLVALALLWLAIRRKRRQWGRKTTAAAGPPQSLEEAEQYTGKPELDSQDTAMRDAGIAEKEETSTPYSPASALAAQYLRLIGKHQECGGAVGRSSGLFLSRIVGVYRRLRRRNSKTLP